MKRQPVWRLSVTAVPQAEDVIAEFLESTFGLPPCSYTDLETSTMTVSVYSGHEICPSSSFRANLKAGLKARLDLGGFASGSARLTTTKMRARDWAEAWKRHFHPIEIGSQLLIKPSWSKRLPRKGQSLVVLDPGLSFGTGQHPTTAFCLRQVVLRHAPGASCLDIGTGSGILAIAAAKLGYTPVEAFDFDPDAVRVARANSRKNGVASRVQIEHQDLSRLPLRSARKFSVVCANLLGSLLLQEPDRILNRLAPGGLLVLAGILSNEFPRIQKAYERCHLQLVAAKTEKEWRSGAFAFTGKLFE